ncbi:MAG: CHAD domain-containing protein [Ilumatobacteraceae bacterium]
MHTVTFYDQQQPLESALAVLAAAGCTVGPPVTSVFTLLDTFDGRLHAADLRLVSVSTGRVTELRLADGRSAVAALPAPQAWASTSAPTATPGAPASSVARFAADLPPGPFRSRLAAATEPRALMPVFTYRSVVRGFVKYDRSTKVIVSGSIFEQPTVGRRVDPSAPWLIEVVEQAGHSRAFDSIDEALAGLRLERATHDAITSIAGLAGVALSGVPPSPTVAMHPSTPAGEAVRAVLANLSATIETNWQPTIDELDTEFLHDLRVAVRRTRSVLTEIKNVVADEIRDHYRGEFGWLGNVTSRPRDLDVYLLEWDSYIAPLAPEVRSHLAPVVQLLQRHRSEAHVGLVQAMRSERAAELRSSWATALTTAGFAEQDKSRLAGEPIGAVVAARIRAVHRKLIGDGRRISAGSPAEALHELRKEAKRLRYLVECFASVLPGKQRKAFVDELKALQDNLGEHQDAGVHAGELRDVAHDLDAVTTTTATLVALGQLSEQLDRRCAETRNEFAVRFRAYDSKRVRSALDELLSGLDG